MSLERGKIIEWGKEDGEWETSNKLLLLYCLYFTRTCYCNSERRNLDCGQVNSNLINVFDLMTRVIFPSNMGKV